MRSKWFPLVVCVIMLGFSAVVYNRLPEQVASHWNLRGEIDAYQPRLIGVLFLPILILLLWGFWQVLPRLDPKAEAYAQFEGTWRLLLNGVVSLFALLQVIVLGTALGWQINVMQWIGGGVSLLFMLIGNEMRRLQPNWFAGIRTPWTLSDPTVWRDTHVVGGRAFFGLGLVMLAAALIRPEWFFVAVIGGVLVVTVGVFGYSYLRYRELHPGASA